MEHNFKYSNDSNSGFELIGVATSAYQIEGNIKGKPESVWDKFTHSNPQLQTGDKACDEINRYHETINHLKELGVNVYRFSMSWTRCLTKDGIIYYHNLINELLKNNIKPMVTIYHWDHPQFIEDEGGWINRDTVHKYVEYAKMLFNEFPQVKYWITLNEPRVVAHRGYGSSTMAPGKNDPKLIPIVNHHLLLAHGLAVQEYRKLNLNGQIGITLNLKPIYHEDINDKEYAEKMDEEKNRYYLDSILGYSNDKGDFILDDFILDEDLNIISSTIDFLGVNYYSRAVVYDNYKPKEVNCLGWEVYPSGIYDLLLDINERYGNFLPPIIITENGYASNDKIINNQIEDTNRVRYIFNHINAIKQAQKAGVSIKGYIVWSLMDNLEWSFGFKPRFGLIYVNFDTLERIPKRSFYEFQKFIKNK